MDSNTNSNTNSNTTLYQLFAISTLNESYYDQEENRYKRKLVIVLFTKDTNNNLKVIQLPDYKTYCLIDQSQDNESAFVDFNYLTMKPLCSSEFIIENNSIQVKTNNCIQFRSDTHEDINKIIGTFDKNQNLFDHETSESEIIGKFFYDTKLNYFTWFSIDDSYTSIRVESTDIQNKVARIKVLTYDIETHSTTGDFPSATNAKNVIICIGTIIATMDNLMVTSTKAILFFLGKCPDIDSESMKNLTTFSFLQNNAKVLIKNYNTECELLYAFSQMVVSEDIDIILGYNNHKFDDIYTYMRTVLTGPIPFFENKAMYTSRIPSTMDVLVEKEMTSKARGVNLHYYINRIGRYNLDVYTYVKNLVKLKSYTLDAVAKEYNIETKLPLDKDKLFEYYSKQESRGLLEIGVYCLRDCAVTFQLVLTLQMLTSLIEVSKLTYTSISDLINRGQQHKIYNLLMNYCRKHNYYNNYTPQFAQSMVPKSTIGRFKAKYHPEKTIINVTLFSQRGPNLNSVFKQHGLQKVIVKGKFQTLQNTFIWQISKCVIEVIESRQSNVILCKVVNILTSLGFGILYDGATVFEPIAGFYKTPIVIFDFQSLYPTIMMAYNICYSTYVKPEYRNEAIRKYCWVIRIAPKFPAEIVGIDLPLKEYLYEHWIVKHSTGIKGILPRVLEYLLEFRKQVKQSMKPFSPDTSEYKLYDKRQDGAKVTANSIYGFIGSEGKMTVGIAHIVTAFGRRCLELLKKEVESRDWTISEQEILDLAAKDGNLLSRNDGIVKVDETKLSGSGKKNLFLLNSKEETLSESQLDEQKRVINSFEPGFVNIEQARISTKTTVVYGDTDSILVNFHLQGDEKTTRRIAFLMGRQIQAIIPRILPSEFVLNLEAAFAPLFLSKQKKRYTAVKYMSIDDLNRTLLVKGFSIVKSDFPTMLQRIHRNAIEMTFFRNEIPKNIFDYVKNEVLEIFGSDFLNDFDKYNQFSIAKSLKMTYSTMNPQQRVLEDMKKRKVQLPSSGQKVSYVYTLHKDATEKFTGKSAYCFETSSAFIKKYPINLTHYWTLLKNEFTEFGEQLDKVLFKKMCYDIEAFIYQKQNNVSSLRKFFVPKE